MKGYVPGLQPTDAGWLKLNTNENPYPPPPSVMKAIREIPPERLALYPPPLWNELRDKFARAFSIEPEMVLVGNGSDELLSIVCRGFLGEGDTLLIVEPTYSLYEVLADIQGAKTSKIKLGGDFSLPPELFDRKADLMMISNPNSPAGTLYTLEQMERLCRSVGGVVVVDEAYVDFSRWNCLELVGRCDNVVVLRTLSKSFSMAGGRVGFAIAQKVLTEGMLKVKDSYNMNCISQIAASAAIDNIDYFRQNINKICRERARLSEELKALGWKVFPSDANFILVQPIEIKARNLYEQLAARKVLVRFFDKPGLDQYLRITIGTGEQTELLLDAIKTISTVKN